MRIEDLYVQVVKNLEIDPYVIKMRGGVHFQPTGQPLDVNDILYAYGQLLYDLHKAHSFYGLNR